MPVIATNSSANSAVFYLNRNSTNQSLSLSRISSGSRIVNSADDAAGLAVSDQLGADVSTLEVASRTTQQVEALLQIADGGAARIGDILQRIKALATQYNSGTVDATSQTFLETEFDLLKTEINLIESSTLYNGTALLDGTYNKSIVAGTAATDLVVVDLSSVNLDFTTLTIPDDLSEAADLTKVDAGITKVGTARARIGALTSAVKFQGENLETQIQNLKAARSTISDVDIAKEQTNFTNFQVLTEAAISGLSKSNEQKQSLLSLLR